MGNHREVIRVEGASLKADWREADWVSDAPTAARFQRYHYGEVHARFGAYSDWFGGLAGESIHKLWVKCHHKFGVPLDASAYIGNREVSNTYILVSGDHVEWHRPLPGEYSAREHDDRRKLQEAALYGSERGTSTRDILNHVQRENRVKEAVSKGPEWLQKLIAYQEEARLNIKNWEQERQHLSSRTRSWFTPAPWMWWVLGAVIFLALYATGSVLSWTVSHHNGDVLGTFNVIFWFTSVFLGFLSGSIYLMIEDGVFDL